MPPQGGAPVAPLEQAVVVDQPMNDLAHIPIRAGPAATAVRDNFCTYVNTVGSVPWQHRMVFGEN